MTRMTQYPLLASRLATFLLLGGLALTLPVQAACRQGHGMGKTGCGSRAGDTIGGDATAGHALAAQHCARCHGVDGNPSNDPSVPALAGQRAGYLLTQLQNFKLGGRHNARMTPVAEQLAESSAIDLAAWYSRQRRLPRAAPATPEMLARGRALYTEGDTSRHLPACAMCHEADGGHGPRARFPTLAGQSAPYLRTQLAQFQSGERTARPGMMRMIAARLDDEDIEAVTAFISAQH